MEIINLGEKTYYIKNATNIGIYKINDKDVYIIDSGSDKDAGKKILSLITNNGWNIKGIINTHSHADHIGGNKIIQDRTECEILSYGSEKAFIEYPILEPSLLYGASPVKDLKNKFLLASESKVEDIEENLPNGLEYIILKGHSPSLIGIKTSDDVVFLGDAIISDLTVNKYHVFYLYDVRQYLESLDILENMEAKTFVASHFEATDNIKEVININRNKIFEILNNILNFLNENKTFEEVLKLIFDHYSLNMNINQYVLISSTIKAYMTYLYEEEKITFEFIDNKMYWKKVD